jgi:hypothetical protein
MAADTAEKRYSAMNMGCPWRGLNALPNNSPDNRLAVMFLYILIAAISGQPYILRLMGVPTMSKHDRPGGWN